MDFRKLLSTGVAVAGGLMAAASGAQAQTMISFTDSTTIPNISLKITDLGNAYELTLSTLSTTGAGDFLGFGFQYALLPPVIGTDTNGDPILNPDALDKGDISYESAYNAPGSESVDPNDKFDTDELSTLYTESVFCADTTGDGIDSCGTSSNNFGGEVRDPVTNEKVTFDYILNIGNQGTQNSEGVDEITFRIAATGGTADLLTANPFSNLTAARLQSTGSDPDLGGGDSVKATLLCTDCDRLDNPDLVPEIDGPVLIQVGFALGGLYLLLLGRRREEDELAHAA